MNQAANSISTPDELTPDRLCAILGRDDVMAVTVILSKDLPVSSVHRLAVEYAGESEGSPDALFLKLSKPAAAGFEPGDLDRPEVDFYLNLAASIGCPPLIKCYDAMFDQATGRSHVLMEDLSDTHTQPEQKTTPSGELSRSAVEALARVHRTYWNSHSMSSRGGSDIPGRRFDEAWLSSFVEDLERDVAEFIEFAGLKGKPAAAYGQMLAAAPRIWGRLLDVSDLTVTHGDAHWWNFLYPKDLVKDSVRIFDWQLWHIDLGARDLAFLLALGGFAEPRPALEERLLHAYHETLAIEDYKWEALFHDYRMSAIRNLNIAVILWKQGKHYSTWQDALRRASEAFERLRCSDLM